MRYYYVLLLFYVYYVYLVLTYSNANIFLWRFNVVWQRLALIAGDRVIRPSGSAFGQEHACFVIREVAASGGKREVHELHPAKCQLLAGLVCLNWSSVSGVLNFGRGQSWRVTGRLNMGRCLFSPGFRPFGKFIRKRRIVESLNPAL